MKLIYQKGRRQWHPTPVLLPGKSHGQRSLVGCRGLSRVEAGNPGFPRLVQVTSGGFSRWLWEARETGGIFPLLPTLFRYFLKWNKVQKFSFHLRWRKPQEITPTITMRKSWIIYKILTCLGPIKNWTHKISKWTEIREGWVPLRRYGTWTLSPVPEHGKNK